MAIDPRAGQPAPERLLVDVDLLRDAYYTRTPDVDRRRAARPVRHERPSRVVAARHVQRSARARHHPGDLQLPQRARDRWPVVPRQGYARALGAGVQNGAGGAGRKRRRGDDRQRRGLHADAGDLPRDPRAQPPAARHAAPTGSSSRPRTIRPRMAASNTTRRLEARPIPASRDGSRRDRMSCWPRSLGSVRRIAYEKARRADRDASLRHARLVRQRPGIRRGHGRHQERGDQERRRSARRRQRHLLGPDRRAATGSTSKSSTTSWTPRSASCRSIGTAGSAWTARRHTRWRT